MGSSGTVVHPARAMALAAVASGLLWVSSALATAPLARAAAVVLTWRAAPASDFAALVEGAAAATALGCSAWLLLACLLLLRDAAFPGAADGPSWLRPGWLRRLATAGCGAALGLSVAVGPGSAATVPDSGTAAGSGGGTRMTSVSGLTLPDRVAGTTTVRNGTQHKHAVEVGDSLWLIARRMLPAHSSTSEVAAATRLLHRANRARVGADPDLIFPGTTLHVPTSLRPGKDRS